MIDTWVSGSYVGRFSASTRRRCEEGKQLLHGQGKLNICYRYPLIVKFRPRDALLHALLFCAAFEFGGSVACSFQLMSTIMPSTLRSFSFLAVAVLSSFVFGNVAAFSERAIPSDWIYKGCYIDSTAARSLSGTSYTSQDAMTNDACISYCDAAGYTLAGTEYVCSAGLIFTWPLHAH